MAATFNPSLMMTLDFYQEYYSDDMSPSSKGIESVLGTKLDSDLADFVDSMTGRQAYELLCKVLGEHNA